MQIEFNTTQWEFSHGGMPRGRGSWFFDVETESDAKRDAIVASAPVYGMRAEANSQGVTMWTPGSTTYTEARKMVRRVLGLHLERADVMVGA